MEKTFTQEEVNKIVADRVARIKVDNERELQSTIDDLQGKLLTYEKQQQEQEQEQRQQQARKLLTEAGLPETLINAFNYTNENELKNIIEQLPKQQQTTGVKIDRACGLNDNTLKSMFLGD